MSTLCHYCNYDTILLNISETYVHHICLSQQWINQHLFCMLHQILHMQLWKRQVL